MKSDRFMILVMLVNLGACVLHFLFGSVDAGLGWLVGFMWSFRAYSLELRIKSIREKGKDEGGELFGFDDHDV